MNSLVANVLNRVLGSWVKGLDPQSLQLSIYRGEVQLGPIELRPEIINALGLPITLVSATVERIALTIPWTSLIFSPWTLEISGVSIEVETTEESVAMDKKRELGLFYEAKQRALEQFELAPEDEVPTEPGFAMKMVARVIDNLQLSIGDLQVRVRHPLAHTSFALCFGRFAMLTCNSSWNPEYVSGADVINKITSVDGLEVAFYSEGLGDVSIVEPLDFLIKTELNRGKPDYPKLKADLSLGSERSPVRLNLRPEFVVGVKELNLYFAHYREFRAGVVAQQQLRDLGPSEIDEYQALYTAWQKNPQEAPEDLLAFERDKHAASLIAQRRVVRNKLSISKSIYEKEAAIQALESAQGSRLGRLAGWLTFSGSSDSENLSKIAALKSEIAELKAKQETLAKELEVFVGEKPTSGNDAKALSFTMEKFQMKFFDKNAEALLLEMNGLKANLSYSATDVNLFLGHKEITLRQNFNPESVFPIIALFTNLRTSYQSSGGLHKLVYTAKESYIVYDPLTIQYFVNILNDLTPKNIDLEGYSRQISAKTLKYVKLGRAASGSVFDASQPQRLSVMVMAQAPHFYVPLRATGQCLYWDLGYVKAKTKSQSEGEVRLYDEFEVELENTLLELWEHAQGPKGAEGDKETVISKFSVSSKVMKALDVNSLVAFASETTVQPISITLSDTFLKFVFSLLSEVKSIWASLTPAETIATVVQSTAYEMGQNIQVAMQTRRTASPCNLKAALSSLEVVLVKDKQPFRQVTLERVSSATTVDRNANVQVSFTLGELRMQDPSAVAWPQLMAPALPWQEDESAAFLGFESVLEPELRSLHSTDDAPAMLQVRYSFEALLNSTVIWIRTQPILMSPNAESFRRLRIFLAGCMELHAEHKARQAVKAEVVPAAPEEALELRREHSRRSQHVSAFSVRAEIGSVKLCVPEAPDTPGSRVLCLELEAGARYSTEQSTAFFYDDRGLVFRQEATQRKDDVVLKVFEVHSYFVSIEHFQDGQWMPNKAAEDVRDLLRPMRAHVLYSCEYQNNVDDIVLEVNVEYMEASISYRDIRSLKAISNSFQNIMEKSTAKPRPPAPSTRLTKYDIDIKWETAIVGLVDDFRKNSTPVLKAVFSNFSFETTLFQSFFLLKAGAAMEIRYFNTAVMEWELVLEEVMWRAFALEPKDFTEGKSAAVPPRPIASFELSLSNVAKVNVSLSMLASVGNILKSVQRLMAAKTAMHTISQDTERDAEKIPQQRYVFHNQLGRPISISLRHESPAGYTFTLEGYEKKEVTKATLEQELGIQTNRAQRRFGGHYYDLELPTTMSLRIDAISIAENVRIDDTALHHFTISETLKYTFGGLIDKHSKGQQQVLAFQSLLRIVNRTDFPLSVRANDESAAFSLDPDCSLPAPLAWTEPAQLLYLSAGKRWVEVSLSGNMELDSGLNVVVDEVDLEVKGTMEVLQVLVISPPLSVLNSLPYLVTGEYKDVKIDLEPGRTVKSSTVPYSSKPQKWVWTLTLTSRDSATTPKVPLKDGEQSYKLSGHISADKFTLNCERNVFQSCLDFDLSEYTQVRAFYHSRVAVLYAPYILVNNTNFKLDFKAERTFLQIGPLASGLAVVEKPTFKVRLTGDEFGTTSSYSEKFNGSTVGLAGCLQTLHKDKVFEETPDSVRFGVLIEQAPWPLSQSKVIRIYPRFFVFNLSSADLMLQQEGTARTFSIPRNTREPFHFPKSDNLLLRISEDEVNWSSCFSLENLDSFQVTVRAQKPLSAEEQAEMASEASDLNLDPLCLKPTRPRLTRFLDVFVSTANEAVIFLIIKDPQYPSVLLQNQTDEIIEVWQLHGEQRSSILPMSSIPFTLENLMENDPKIVLSTAGDLQVFSLSKEKVFTKQLADYEVSLSVSKVTKVVRVSRPVREEANKIAKKLLRRILLTRTDTDSDSVVYDHFVYCKFCFTIKGIEVSLIDGTPSELFVLAIEDVKITAKRKVTEGVVKDYSVRVQVTVGSLQVDNMSDGKEEFPVVLAQRYSETALLSFLMKTKSSYRVKAEDLSESLVSYQVKRLNLSLQELMLQVHQDTLVHLLDVISQVQGHFRYKTEVRSDEAYLRRARESVAEVMKTEMPGLREGDELSTKVFFELVNLGSIKLTISYRTISKKRHFILNNDSSDFAKILGKIASAIVNISNSNLYFSSILLHKSFKSFQELIRSVVRNYARQGALQFYRLLGASELIGNPLGLINKLGTGVFEFFDEPRKGLKNPKDFAKGVGRGVRALVSSVVSGSMESVSQVTGSLYRIVSQDQSASRTGQFAKEFKGSVEGLASGLTGLVTKPIEGAKEGFSGFVYGVGTGVYGAVTAPVSMVLRVSSNVASNIADATTFTTEFGYKRKRFPRYFGPRKRLLPYNRALAEVREYWKHYSLHYEKELFCIELSLKVAVLITNSRIVVLQAGQMQGSVDLSEVTSLKVMKLLEDSAVQRFLFVVSARRRKLRLISTRFAVMGQLYEVLSALLQPILSADAGLPA